VTYRPYLPFSVSSSWLCSIPFGVPGWANEGAACRVCRLFVEADVLRARSGKPPVRASVFCLKLASKKEVRSRMAAGDATDITFSCGRRLPLADLVRLCKRSLRFTGTLKGYPRPFFRSSELFPFYGYSVVFEGCRVPGILYGRVVWFSRETARAAPQDVLGTD